MRAGLRVWLAAGAAAALLTACQTPAGEPAQASQVAQQEIEEPLDPFVVMIGVERWGVLIDLAYQGAIEAPYADDARDEDNKLRTDRAVKSGAAELIRLRNMICAKGLLSGADCDFGEWPAWVMKPPVDNLSWEEMDQRSEWLSIQMARFVEVGCRTGREASGNEMFCSVE